MNLLNRLAHYLVGSFNHPAFPSPIRAQFIQSGVIVPDISFYQDLDETTEMVNFAKMKANGAKGVIIRAGQGGWNDEDFAAYWRDSKDVLPRGIYWFYDSRYTPTAQATFIANAVKTDGMPEMEIWCDYEESYSGAYAGWRSFAVFMTEIERLIPWAKLGIYSGYWYWIDHSPNPITEAASFNWFKKYPLWLASYTPAAQVRIPKPWDNLTYWQYTSTGDGAAYGVESKGIDLSAFNGTYGDFLARYNLTTPPPPPDTLPVVTIVNVTPEPNGPITIVGTVRQGDIVTGFEQVYTPPVTPPPTPAPSLPHLYRIKDDLQAGVKPNGTRDYVRNGTACTVRMQGVNSSVTVPQSWVNYLQLINTPKGFNYLYNDSSGWHNGAAGTVGTPLKVETVLMGGNVIEVARIEGDRAYFKCVHPSDPPPAVKVIPNPPGSHPLIHNFSVQYATGLDMSINDKWPLILPLVPDGQEPWIDIKELVRL